MRMGLIARLDARDRALFARWVLETASGRRRAFWRTVTHVGGTRASVAAALLPIVAGHGAVRQAGLFAAAVLACSHLLVQLCKRTIVRPRPSAAEVHVAVPDAFSFPSGHSCAAMAIAFAYGLCVPALAPVLLPLAALVGLSRVVLGVHYPGDVLAGQALAIVTGVALHLGGLPHP
ncbi:MAG: phosphatase PAP2 family protein [Gemmatimonadales bacterium]|nr:phosphatase PAP2 family protein [Gemmatimonadales bacterium]